MFKLGTRYSETLGASFKDATGAARPIIMGCYGIGIGRLLVAAVEHSHDQRGTIWPTCLAPYTVIITPVKYEGKVKRVADELHDRLNAVGIDTLLDDRDARAGFKFADADLIGIPIRIVIGEKNLQSGRLELKRRQADKADLIGLNDIEASVKQCLSSS